MFFAKDSNPNAKHVNEDGISVEKVAIFGSRRSRRGAELKVMSAVEHKSSGVFTDKGPNLLRPIKE